MMVAAWILGFLILGGLGFMIYHLRKMQQQREPEDSQSSKLLLEIIENLRREVQDSGGKSRVEMQDRLDKITAQISRHQQQTTDSLQKQFFDSRNIISEVAEKLTKLEQTNQQVLGFTEQMKTLENILKNPKQRGIMGEFFLENLLSNVLPPSNFKMQYSFENGETVDAVVFVKEKIVPIDAKFSLENYNRLMQETDPLIRDELEKRFKNDLKLRIDETSKYVRPKENTTEFAMMFIPADGIFYNLLVQKTGTLEINSIDLIQYANNKNVTIVSPMTFYAYLQTILHALRSMQIEESAKEIQSHVADLGRHLNAYQDHLNRLGNQLGTTVNTYNESSREFKKIDKDVLKITGQAPEAAFEPQLIEKPVKEQP